MARLVASAIVLVLALTHCGTWALDVAVVPRAPSFGASADLRGLLRRIDAGAQKDMRRTFPEGGLFLLSFTGFALVNVAVQHPDDEALRARTRAALKKLLSRSEVERSQPPFSSWGRRAPGARGWRGVILEGHQNLLRAGYAVLGGKDPDIRADYHHTSAALFAMFMRSPSGALESFAHRSWYVDNVVALESLRLHDVLYGSHYSTAITRFRAGFAARVDDKSGLPPSEVSLDGARTLDGPRGCALSWLLAFTPDLSAADPARPGGIAWWARYREVFGVDVFGMRGFREYPRWRRGHANIDSGPIVAGIGAAASAFGVAAARAHGDGDTLGRMLLPLEIWSAPALTLHGDEELFFGALPLADAIAVWGRTLTPWDAPGPPPPTSPPLLPTLAAEAVLLAPVLLAAAWFRRSLARFAASRGTTALRSARGDR